MGSLMLKVMFIYWMVTVSIAGKNYIIDMIIIIEFAYKSLLLFEMFFSLYTDLITFLALSVTPLKIQSGLVYVSLQKTTLNTEIHSDHLFTIKLLLFIY